MVGLGLVCLGASLALIFFSNESEHKVPVALPSQKNCNGVIIILATVHCMHHLQQGPLNAYCYDTVFFQVWNFVTISSVVYAAHEVPFWPK